jgi:glycosyltransferase involved in cell wall biosynthesis
MKTILVISYSNLAADPRVNRQIRWLNESYRVIAAGLADPGVPGVRFISLSHVPPRKNSVARGVSALQILARRFEHHYWRLPATVKGLTALAGVRADLILANDIEALPLALRLAGDRPVIFDAHEYAPRQFDNSLHWRIFLQPYRASLCRTYIPRTAAMFTVCQGIADQYRRDTGVTPVVMTNAPEYHDIRPNLKPVGETVSPDTSQDASDGLAGTRPEPAEARILRHGQDTRVTSQTANKIRMIHHGAASPPREIERMIAAMRHLDDRFELDFLLVPGSPEYISRLEEMARPDPRIRFLPPVPMRELVRFSSTYDIGLFLVPPTTFNLRHTLPNKFFEFIQARLAVAVGPSPEMARIVEQTGCGIVAADFTPGALADALARLDHAQINRMKQNSDRIARAMSAERNREILFEVVTGVLEEPVPARAAP